MQIKQIKIAIAGMIIGSTLMLSCTKVNRDDNFPAGDVPPIAGGFTSADQIATSNLLAYWSFENSKVEVKSNTEPLTDISSSYVPGIKGQALSLNEGYVIYPTIAALSSANALTSCSVSLWIKVANNGSTFSEYFTLARDTTVETSWLSILNVGVETGQSTSNNFIDLHSWIGSFNGAVRSGGDNINDYGAAGSDYQVVPPTSNWLHYVMRYDAPSQSIDLFANSVRVSNNNFRYRGGPNGAIGLGPIVVPTPTQVVLGAMPTATVGFSHTPAEGWQSPLTGSMDEIRVYNKALSDGEISALYQLEKSGR